MGVVRDIVVPQTRKQICCYADVMEGGPKQPQRLVSHCWGAPFQEVAECIIEDASCLRVVKLPDIALHGKLKPVVLKMPYWMCIFAVNQHVSICGTESFPCNCGRQKYPSGHERCQVDKFDEVMNLMPDGITVALDAELQTLSRAWCLAEIGEAIRLNQRIRFVGKIVNQPSAIDITVPSVAACQATYPSDREFILEKIRSTVGVQNFDRRVSQEILHGVRPVLGRAMRRAEAQVGALGLRPRYHMGAEPSEHYAIYYERSWSKSGNLMKLAKNKATGTEHLMKRLSLEIVDSEKVMEMTTRAEILLTIDHPHIARLFDV